MSRFYFKSHVLVKERQRNSAEILIIDFRVWYNEKSQGKKMPWLFYVYGWWKRYFSSFWYVLERLRVFIKIAFRPSEKSCIRYLFTVTYYLPKIDKRILVKSEEWRVKSEEVKIDKLLSKLVDFCVITHSLIQWTA